MATEPKEKSRKASVTSSPSVKSPAFFWLPGVKAFYRISPQQAACLGREDVERLVEAARNTVVEIECDENSARALARSLPGSHRSSSHPLQLHPLALPNRFEVTADPIGDCG